MRLHQLSITAFGPFAGTESVDFDHLNDAGLFLLCGATGAGKTSILDAVCFALFGTVPGVRGVKTLKSQHATDDIAPEVVLEFSVRERRFRIRRSPEWSRPKLRGTGTITEKAAASLTEITDAEERFLSSRAAEVGLLVSELVGMRAAQFQQVAMLPQGDFQRFLQASSQDRHDVLQQLFQTDRFSRIEDWVNDHSRDLRQRSQIGETRVRQLLHTLAEVAGTPLPESLGQEAPAQALGAEPVLSWSAEQVRLTRERARASDKAHRDAERAAQATRDRLTDLHRRRDLMLRRDAARARLGLLGETAGEADEARRLLDAHQRAASCRPLVELLDRALADRDRLVRDRHRALADLPDVRLPGTQHHPLQPLDDISLDDADTGLADALAGSEQQAHALATRLDAILPSAGQLERTTALVRTTENDLERLEAEQQRILQLHEQLPVRLREARDQLAASTASAAREEALTLQLRAAATRAEAAGGIKPAQLEVDRLTDLVRDRRDQAADARDTVQRLTALRLAGVAAELAGQLSPGDPCTVCGSTEHPFLASPTVEAVTQEEQADAEAALLETQEALLQVTMAAADAQHVLEARVAAAEGRDATLAAAELEQLHTDLATARAAAGRLAEEARAVADLEEALDQAGAESSRLDSRLAELREQRASHRAEAERISQEIAAVVGEKPPSELPRLLADVERLLARLAEARKALAAHQQAAARVDEVEEQALTTASRQGFSTLDDVRAALLPAERAVALERLLSERAEIAAAATALLSEPEVVAVADEPVPDPAPIEEELAAADAACQEATRAHHLLEQQMDRLVDLHGRVESSLTDWAPLRDEYVRAESMSRLVRGMGSDNHLQMRLSAYVLATRLDQVVDAANERLSHMRDQRYLLQRTGRAARKGSQAGLGLEVLDQWTGDVRDPSTLSGGETFVVSLSLALGLADVVSQEAGGTEIETLFVDEGFGTLDADTLDDVMDRLDGLRAGGRTVGVVSHVTELRTRIPTQLHVRKTSRGSTVHAETLAG